MGLLEREKYELLQIEQRLHVEDPRLARYLSAWGYRPRLLLVLAVTYGLPVILLALALTLGQSSLLDAGLAAAFLAYPLGQVAIRGWRRTLR